MPDSGEAPPTDTEAPPTDEDEPTADGGVEPNEGIVRERRETRGVLTGIEDPPPTPGGTDDD